MSWAPRLAAYRRRATEEQRAEGAGTAWGEGQWPLAALRNGLGSLLVAEFSRVLIMRKKSKIRWANRDHTGWWIFEEVEQWVSKRQEKLSPRSRCLVYVNLRLLRAKSREEAYRKAMKLGRVGRPSKTHGGEWRFAGISMLLPVYEELEDGAEILWKDSKVMTVARMERLVKSRHQLSVFDDTEEDT